MTEKTHAMQEAIEVFQSGHYPLALRLLKPLAEDGNAEAQCMIATIYHLGLGHEVNGVEALKWYFESAKQGYPVASNNLGTIFLMGDCGVEANHLEAARWYQLSREQGFPHTPTLERDGI
jgi:TPR repeat protein